MSEVLVEGRKPEVANRRSLLGTGQVGRAIASLKALLPLDRERFARDFAVALRETKESPGLLCLPNYAARRALRGDLLIQIDPRPMKHRLMHRASKRRSAVYVQDRFLGSGDWQGLLKPIDESTTHRDVQEIVRSDFDYRATEGYQRAMSRVDGPRPARRNFVALSTPRLVERYFQNVAGLCRSIREHGVRRRPERRSLVEAFRHPRVRLPWVELLEADIGVAIGPQGDFVHFGCGKHRIAAALALGLARIPVEVRMVHADWVQRQIDETGLAPLDALIQGIHALDLARPKAG